MGIFCQLRGFPAPVPMPLFTKARAMWLMWRNCHWRLFPIFASNFLWISLEHGLIWVETEDDKSPLSLFRVLCWSWSWWSSSTLLPPLIRLETVWGWGVLSEDHPKLRQFCAPNYRFAYAMCQGSALICINDCGGSCHGFISNFFTLIISYQASNYGYPFLANRHMTVHHHPSSVLADSF